MTTNRAMATVELPSLLTVGEAAEVLGSVGRLPTDSPASSSQAEASPASRPSESATNCECLGKPLSPS